MEQILPVIDTAILQEKANEFAMNGAIASLKEFYTGYDSPYKKAINDILNEKGTSVHLDIPDIIGILNTGISNEIDQIVNTAIGKTFIPLAKELLTRAEAAINFSEILKEFIERTNTDLDDFDECEVDIEEHERWGWLSVTVTSSSGKYEFTLHLDNENKNEPIKKYKLLGLPHKETNQKRNMTVWADNIKIEMPFTYDILKDRFTSFLASLVIAGTIITMDTTRFDEDMFPDDHCHCD